jgi:hypothetical protein
MVVVVAVGVVVWVVTGGDVKKKENHNAWYNFLSVPSPILAPVAGY